LAASHTEAAFFMDHLVPPSFGSIGDVAHGFLFANVGGRLSGYDSEAIVW
jgi:hypothetical protein